MAGALEVADAEDVAGADEELPKLPDAKDDALAGADEVVDDEEDAELTGAPKENDGVVVALLDADVDVAALAAVRQVQQA